MNRVDTKKFSVALRPLRAGAVVAAMLASGALVSSASAQPDSMMVDPNGSVAAPEPAAAAPTPIVVPIGQEAQEGQAAAVDPYYGDYLDEDEDFYNDNDSPYRGQRTGVVPATHTVRSGDTLWDISSYYFGDPWNWPKVWSLNPEITNPHWIYPGNVVRLRTGGEPVATSLPDNVETGDSAARSFVAPSGEVRLGLRQIAYVDLEALEDAARIDGSVDEKTLLSTGDSVYLKYEGAAPKVGEVYSIYSAEKKVKNKKGKSIGSYVRVTGEVQITFVKEGQRARAVITRSIDPVERGQRVGPLKLNFADVQPVANEAKIDGTVVDVIAPDYLIGTDQAVIIDRGSEDGVEAGNRFLVIRRGDAYAPVMAPDHSVGQDDERFPARAIAEIMIVQTEKHASVGIVSFAMHEFGVGDRVFMRQGQ